MLETLAKISILLILTATIAACGHADPEADDRLPAGGKSDTFDDQAGEPAEALAFDEADPRWEQVVECRGWALCLDNIVAARDLTDFDSQLSYPMVLALDEIFGGQDIRVSENCDGNLVFDEEQNVVCLPDDGDPIVFALVDTVRSANGSEWIKYDYESLGRVRLFRHTEVPGSGLHHLEIE